MNGINRRLALSLLMAAALAAAALPAEAAEVTNYTPEALAAAKASGKPFILDFFATWCVTCAAQHRVLDRLRAENPAYAKIPFVQVDWDQNEHGPLVAAMKIPRRSTLVVLKGNAELGRIVALTSDGDIAGLLKLAL
jgi:thiol:disulfide interchange protein